MGYNTYYTLEIHDANMFPLPEAELGDVDEKAVLLSSKTAINIGLDNGVLDDCIKWYNHEEDMNSISKELEDYVFVLYGDGEESDDKWKQIYYQGDHVGTSAEEYYPPINLSKIGLKNPKDATPPEPMPVEEYFWNKEDA